MRSASSSCNWRFRLPSCSGWPRFVGSANCVFVRIRHRQSMPDEVWRGVSVVKLNELEAEVLTGISVIDLGSAEQAARWFLDRGATIAMITRGPHGAVLVGPDGIAEYPAFPATPVDTSGR